MTAAEVRQALTLRWPDDRYLGIDEAPQDSSRQGRKLDVLFLALWQSRGLQLEGVEIKVSTSDWVRELREAEKSDFWWRHVHRFWVAVPAHIAERVRQDLPETWGLLACEVGKTPTVAVKAPHHEAEPLSWGTTVGVMRAAADCGVNALARARSDGREEGYRQGKEAAERGTSDIQLQQLRQTVEAFEEASGIHLSHWDAGHVGEIVRLIQQERHDPGWVFRAASSRADRLEQAVEAVRAGIAQIKDVSESISRIVAAGGAP